MRYAVHRNEILDLPDNARSSVTRTAVQNVHRLHYQTLPQPSYPPDPLPTLTVTFKKKYLDHF